MPGSEPSAWLAASARGLQAAKPRSVPGGGLGCSRPAWAVAGGTWDVSLTLPFALLKVWGCGREPGCQPAFWERAQRGPQERHLLCVPFLGPAGRCKLRASSVLSPAFEPHPGRAAALGRNQMSVLRESWACCGRGGPCEGRFHARNATQASRGTTETRAHAQSRAWSQRAGPRRPGPAQPCPLPSLRLGRWPTAVGSLRPTSHQLTGPAEKGHCAPRSSQVLELIPSVGLVQAGSHAHTHSRHWVRTI